MIIRAIDPGPVLSAYVDFDTETRLVVTMDKIRNDELLESTEEPGAGFEKLYIEMIASQGMAVGASVFRTCVWIGVFAKAFKGDCGLIPRPSVKLHMCGSSRANDANISASVANRYGGDTRTAKGTKKSPGPLYGISKDIWQALALAITATENPACVEWLDLYGSRGVPAA